MGRRHLRSVANSEKAKVVTPALQAERTYDRVGLTILGSMLGVLALGNLLVYLEAFSRVPQLAIWLTVSKEASFATWIQVQVWAGVAAVATLETISLRGPKEKRSEFYRWAFIATFFAWLSVDDFLSIHEAFGQTARRFFGTGALGSFGQTLSNFRSNLWLVTLGPIYAAGFYITLDGLRRELPRSLFMKLVPAAVACFALAVGIDFVEGVLRRSAGPDFWAMPGASWLYLAVTVEELLEIAGSGLLLQATLDATIPGFRRRVLGR